MEGPGRGCKRKPSQNKNIVVEEKSSKVEPRKSKPSSTKSTNEKTNGAAQPTRTLQKKVNQFMSHLTSMLETVFEDAEDYNLPQ